MRERPILFQGEMVRAILDNRKTQTRRIMKPQPEKRSNSAGSWYVWQDFHCESGDRPGIFCPYGAPGDELWVREKMYYNPEHDNWYYSADHKGAGQTVYERLRYRMRKSSEHSRPSIHMPRWASRIQLRITDVRVQRVQEISIDDIEAEGVYRVRHATDDREDTELNRCEFADLWDSINAKRGFGWEVNPWVWAITFERIRP